MLKSCSCQYCPFFDLIFNITDRFYISFVFLSPVYVSNYEHCTFCKIFCEVKNFNFIIKIKHLLKQEETLDELEVEYKVQSGIAEAALGVANDTTASKAVRRKHRLMYQQSRRRLAELEAKLELLRQSSNKPQQTKQRKKPRPPLDNGINMFLTD